MFKKIVTELVYSPALAGNLGDYIKQLRSERSKRQIGLVFVLLAFVVQMFTASFPPESANASNPAVFIDGGIQSIDDYLHHYDQNTRNIQDLLRSLGIDRSDIKSAKQATPPSTIAASQWSMQNSRDETSFSYSFNTRNGKSELAYYQPVDTAALTSSNLYIGSSAKANTWFAVAQESGNLITETPRFASCPSWFSTSLSTPADTWNNTAACPASLEPSLTARTVLSGSTSPPSTAQASDRIEYTLTLRNTGESALVALPSINLEDVLEYSRILDSGHGEYDYDTRMLSWPKTTLAPEKSLERRFIIQLLPSIPSTPRGQYTDASYDCTLQATFGTSLTTPVACPFVKDVESFTNSLVTTSKKVNVIFGCLLLLTTLYFYLRSRQLLTELYIIRHNNLGGL